MNRQTYEKLAVSLLLMIFVLAIGNIIFNLENLYMGVEGLPEFVPQGGGGAQQVATSDTVINALKWISYGFVGLCVVVIVIAAITFTASKDRMKWRRLLAHTVAVLLTVAAIFALGFFYEDIERSVTGGGGGILPSGMGNSHADGNVTVSPEAPDTLSVIMTFGLFAMIFLFCVMVIMAINNFLRMRSTDLDSSHVERDSQEVVQTIQRTIDALADGSDTRSTVIRCYTEMCGVMARHGLEEEEHLTPREFQNLAQEHLPVPREQMEALVKVFEEARYSNHDLDEKAGRRAVAALEGVKAELARGIRKNHPPEDV